MSTAEITAFEIKPSGAVRITYKDGHSSEYTSLDAIKEEVALLDSDPYKAEIILLGWFLARQPLGSNTNIVIGKTLTFDLSSASPIKVQ